MLSLLWGWDECSCSYSKDKSNQDATTEQLKIMALNLIEQENEPELLKVKPV